MSDSELTQTNSWLEQPIHRPDWMYGLRRKLQPNGSHNSRKQTGTIGSPTETRTPLMDAAKITNQEQTESTA